MWWCRKDLRYTELELVNARNKDAYFEVTCIDGNRNGSDLLKREYRQKSGKRRIESWIIP